MTIATIFFRSHAFQKYIATCKTSDLGYSTGDLQFFLHFLVYAVVVVKYCFTSLFGTNGIPERKRDCKVITASNTNILFDVRFHLVWIPLDI